MRAIFTWACRKSHLWLVCAINASSLNQINNFARKPPNG
jgi:hypothetical protein